MMIADEHGINSQGVIFFSDYLARTALLVLRRVSSLLATDDDNSPKGRGKTSGNRRWRFSA